jgi:fructosamine-3-kinase
VTLPAALARSLTRRLDLSSILAARPLGGGCIHQAARVDTPSGSIFCKWNVGAVGRGFGAEARGLDSLREAASDGGLVIPEVLGWMDAGDEGPGWLALAYLPPSRPGADYDEQLGRGLAALHAPVDGAWGWSEDNLIGSLAQANPPTERWDDFWADARLGAQIEMAAEGGRIDGTDRRLLERTAAESRGLLDAVEADGPSIVHGDLWAGNVHAGPDGRPVLIDPAVYRGHREVDLAMADLFGGLSDRAASAYREVAPPVDGYLRRRPLYQLYYLLVHLNLFGSSYLEPCRRAARAACAAE